MTTTDFLFLPILTRRALLDFSRYLLWSMGTRKRIRKKITHMLLRRASGTTWRRRGSGIGL